MAGKKYWKISCVVMVIMREILNISQVAKFSTSSVCVQYAFATCSVCIRYVFGTHSVHVRYGFGMCSVRVQYAFGMRTCSVQVQYEFSTSLVQYNIRKYSSWYHSWKHYCIKINMY